MVKVKEAPLMEESLYKLTEGLKPETLIIPIEDGDKCFVSFLEIAKTQGYVDVNGNCSFFVRADYEVKSFCQHSTGGWMVNFVPRFSCFFTTRGYSTRYIDTLRIAVQALIRVVAIGVKEKVSFDIDPIEEVSVAGLGKNRKRMNELTHWRFVEKS